MQNYCSLAALVFSAILGIGDVIASVLTRAKSFLKGRVALVGGIAIACVAASLRFELRITGTRPSFCAWENFARCRGAETASQS